MARLSQQLYRQVAARARDHCEYCGLPQEAEVMDLTVDHVVPQADQGSSDLSNLALACLACNARKWKFTHGTDSQTGRTVPLFDPRRQRWLDHFQWTDDDVTRIEGKTATGSSHGRIASDEFPASRPNPSLAHANWPAPTTRSGVVTR